MDHRKATPHGSELAVAPGGEWHPTCGEGYSIRCLEHGGAVFFFLVDERWLRSAKADGFRSRDAVDRFLQLLGAARQEGEPADEGTGGNSEHHCLRLRRTN